MLRSRESRRDKRNRAAGRRRRNLVCETLERRLVLSATIGNNIGVGDQLQNYRLAIAATAEYTAFFGGQSEALAAIESFVSSVNAIFEPELSIHFELVSGINTIFTNAATDGFTNDNVSAMKSQNTTILNNIVGPANYDIGHVFGTTSSGAAGIADLGVVNGVITKGAGASISSNPEGSDWVNLVGHELGHQFGAQHTFNANAFGAAIGNRQQTNAYEPASGSTIMSYAGISNDAQGDDNLQPQPDDYFHSASFEQIQSFVGGNGMPSSLTATGNSTPIVSGGADFTIPAGTPFELTAVGSDADPGDTLTYTWEQIDLGDPMSLPLSDNGSGPLFRAYPPSTNPKRVFPRLIDLAAGVNTAAIGEVLPTTTRSLNFRTTVRDAKGGVNSDDVLISVVDTLVPFAITAPNGAESWTGGTPQSISWNVGGTDTNGINVANVAIDLSIDGGLTYPFTLESSTPNDGTYSLTAPNIDAAEARIRVRPVGNIFFDISDASFAITADAAAAGVTVTESDGSTLISEDGVVGGAAADSFTLALNTVPTSTVTIAVDGGAQTEVSLDNVNFASSVLVDHSDVTAHTIYVRGLDDTLAEGIHSGTITHTIIASNDANYSLGAPINPVIASIADDELQPVIGVDFDQASGSSPRNWTRVSQTFGGTTSNLAREDGIVTPIGLTLSVAGAAGLNLSAPNAVPLHSPTLDAIDGNHLATESLTLTWTGLTPETDYNVYLLTSENFASNVLQNIAITGVAGNPPPFVQDTSTIGNGLLVNGGLADTAKPLEADALIAKADADGEIQIVVTDVSAGGVDDALLSAAAIQEIVQTPSIELTVSIDSVSISENGGTSSGTVTRSGDASGDLTVMLASDNTAEATVPKSVTIHDGDTAAPFTVTGVDDFVVDGTQTVTIIASALQAGGSVGLDPTFGAGGLVTTQLQTLSQPPDTGIDRQADGRIVAASQGATISEIKVTRYHTDGTLDTTFGTNGLAVASPAGNDRPMPSSIVIQEDGKILVGGRYASGIARPFLVRFNSDGTLDTTYGTAGVADLATISGMYITDMGLTPDGKVLAAMGISGTVQLRAMRVDTSGTLDASFGSGGIFTFPGISRSAAAIKVLPSGQFLLVGGFTGDGVVVRAESNGTLDATFGVSGQQTIDFGTSSLGLRDIDVDPTGRVVIVAHVSNGADTADFAVLRLNPDGTFDTTFDTDGKVTTDVLTGRNDFATSMQVQPDSKILVVGYSDPASGSNEVAVVRYHTDGSLDTTFAGDGSFAYSGSLYDAERSHGSLLQADGKLIILSGWSDNYQLARLDTGMVPVRGSATVDVTDDESANVVLFEPFDNANQFTTSHVFFSQGDGSSFFGISDGASGGDFGAAPPPTPTVKAYTGLTGNFLTGMDMDAAPEGATLPITASWTGLDISGKTGLQFSADFAEFWDLPGDIEPSDFLRVEAQIDGGGFVNLLEFRGRDSGNNALIFSVDTNGDGIGDGTQLGDAARNFTADIVGTGSLLDLRISMSVSDQDEDFAIDNVSVTAGNPTGPYIVDTLADQDDGDFSAGNRSLREAIERANTHAGADEIQFAAGLSGGTITLVLGELLITDDVAITGPGAANLTVSGADTFRIFNSQSADVAIDGLTITAGRTTANGQAGGAIRSNGTLQLSNVAVTHSGTTGIAADGGGIFQFGGTLTITDSTISGNHTSGSNSFGGGISSLQGNVIITGTTIEDNSTASGGADTGVGGGLVVISGNLTLIDSTVANNVNTGAGSIGGGVVVASGDMTITGSTISGNSTNSRGGGILFGGAANTATVTNTTVSGNTAGGGDGGGISVFQGTFNLRNSTVTGNTATAGLGGGLASYSDGSQVSNTVVTSSLIAGNTAGNDGGDVDNVLIGLGINTIVSSGFNVIGSGNATTFFGQPTDRIGIIDPGLAPLADNGGPTLTHALLAGSPAIGAGNTTSTETTDQRGTGFARLTGSNVDVGAFELQATDPSVTLTGDNASIPEAAGVATFTATLSEISGEDVTVSLGFTGTATGGGTDYTTSDTQIVIAAGSLTGSITVTAAADTEDEDNETVIVDVTAVSGGTENGTQQATTTILDNVAPIVTLPSDEVTYSEGQLPILLDPAATAVDSDSADFDGGSLTLAITSSATTADRLTISDEGTDTGQIGVVGSNVSFGGVAIGVFSGGIGMTPLVITLSAASSPAATQALLRNIQFDNVSTDPSTAQRVVSATLDDGDGGTAASVTQTVSVIAVPDLDFGDAPTAAQSGYANSYPVTLAQDGARHTPSGPTLGAARDSEANGVPSAAADGDDLDGVDDEEGALFGGLGVTSTTAAVNIMMGNVAAAKVDAWIDFNRDGDWDDAGEKILDSVDVSNPLQTLNYTVPAGIAAGDTHARVRLSTVGGLSPTGLAADGEVEDHLITIGPPRVERVVINGGDPQRSGIKTVQVTFDRVVDIDFSGGDVFQFVNTTTSQAVSDFSNIRQLDGKTVVDFTFLPGPGVNNGGGLNDGNYQLTIDASKVTSNTDPLDGDGDGTGGDNHVFGAEAVDKFYRKFGDFNANGTVELFDFAEFRAAYGKTSVLPGYHEGLDAQNNGVINLLDFAVFRANYGS